MNRFLKVFAASAVTGVIALAAIGPATSSAASLPGCTPATNISAIIDDSGSMTLTDPGKLRSSMVEFIAGSGLMKGKTMSALEFGSAGSPGPAAGVLVAPTQIGDAGAQGTFTSALGVINGDGPAGGSVGTDYDAGFTLSNTSNPGANARLFLSDGAPNSGTYNPAGPSVNPVVKTFVVGLSVSDATALNQIATATNGPPVFTASNTTFGQDLGITTGDVIASMNCKTPPPRIVDQFVRAKQVKAHAFKATGTTADILTTWTTTGTVIGTAPTLKISGPGAVAAKKKGKAKARLQNGPTFSAVHLTGLKKGKKVKFKVKAKTLLGPTTATTQVVQ